MAMRVLATLALFAALALSQRPTVREQIQSLDNPLRLRQWKKAFGLDAEAEEHKKKSIQTQQKKQQKRSRLQSLMNNLDEADKEEKQAFKDEKKAAFKEQQRKFDEQRDRLINRTKALSTRKGQQARH
eukprot:gnl/MRDRNA2_/MRDRNA2_112065_c0_seq1.p1 gnl/MRDRNA2_/MRDRNA2_112065_c0~~gnl/MRDRNA2_/MRDRNA2_112065_c0_seq1.p1  ORF type:complete len:128 (+),score=42.36 gnl/MRDRNA2_/MRDRNA2_112065_c0_seq1:57-440(+)